MSYVSGFMMGTAIGKSIRRMMGAGTPKGQALKAGARRLYAQAAAGDPLALVSDLPGRRRYRARLSAELAALLAAELGKLHFVQTVRVDAGTGSILLTFAEQDAAKVDALAQWLRTRIFASHGASGASASPAAGESADESHAGALTRSVRGSARAFSAWIKRATCGWLDMSAIASLLFAVRGLRKYMLTKSSPSGAQMLWWALSLMRGWRTL